jgi:hypothetical protein
MEYSLPQFLEIKPKIAGPLTLRQLIYIASTGIILSILFFTMPLGRFALIAIFMVGIAVFLAFGKIRGFPAPTVIVRSLKFAFSSKIYLWQKKEMPPQVLPREKKPKEKEAMPPTPTIAGKSRLKKLANLIEIHPK